MNNFGGTEYRMIEARKTTLEIRLKAGHSRRAYLNDLQRIITEIEDGALDGFEMPTTTPQRSGQGKDDDDD